MNVLTQDNHYNRTDKYKVISTEKLLETFTNEGFELRTKLVSMVRNKNKEGFQKHMLRLKHKDLKISLKGLHPEIVIINSFDGSCSFKIMLGLFRFVCLNGMVTGKNFETYTVKHIGNNCINYVIQACNKIKESIPLLEDNVKRFETTYLTDDQQVYFADKIAEYLLKDTKNIIRTDLSSLLSCRREADNGNDVFKVLNRIQENSLNGGLNYTNENSRGKIVTKSIRPIKSIDRRTELNRLIWDVANKFVA